MADDSSIHAEGGIDPDQSQRWLRGRGGWRHRDDLADTGRLRVVEINESVARSFVVEHHYSRSYPAAVHRYGLVDAGADRLVGVCVLGVPMQAKVLTNVFPDLEPYSGSLELSRLVLLDDPVAGANAESWMVSRVFKMAAVEGVRGVVSFSDPHPRACHDGNVVLPGHVGFVYQALGAAYLGRSTSRRLVVMPDGTSLSDRAMSKVRAQDRGHEYVERKLVGFGAAPMGLFEDPAEWLARTLQQIGAKTLHHQGNHRYAWAIGTRSERRTVRLEGDRLDYPKQPEQLAA